MALDVTIAERLWSSPNIGWTGRRLMVICRAELGVYAMPQLTRGLTLCSAALLAACGLLPTATSNAQATFLERLEAKVRDQLNQPTSPPAAPSADSAAGIPATRNTDEELPSPRASQGIPANSLPAAIPPSILELSSGSNNSAANNSADSAANSAATGSGRIYLGLEAEEVTGGGIGVRVTRVTQGSPAWKGGFRSEDRIAAINGFAIASLDSMVEQLGKTKPGQSVKFLVDRNNRNMELVAVLMDADLAERIARGPLPIGQLGAQPTDGLVPNSIPGGAPQMVEPNSNRSSAGTMAPDVVPSVVAAAQGKAWLGVAVNDLTAEFRTQFGLSVFRGAAVTSVSPNSPAAKAGVQAGDAIIAVAQVPIESARDLTAWVSSSQVGETVEIAYQRGIISRTGLLTLEAPPGSGSTRTANRAPTTGSRNVTPSGVLPPAAQGVPRANALPPVPAPDAVQPAETSPEEMAGSPLQPSPLELRPPVADLTTQQMAELQREVAGLRSELEKANSLQFEVDRLKSELEKATQRLESTQSRLQQILDGLGTQ